MATVRDVAKLSGVSPATVTHVLHNRTNISPQTRQRVLEAVRTLGYRPGTVPNSADRERTTQTIGIFIWLEPGFPLRDNPYAAQVLDGILAISLMRQWNVTLFNVTAWDDAHSQLRHMADGRCDGFLLIAPPPSIGIPDALRERGYPFVLVNSGSGDPAVNSVDIDNRAAARELTTYLIEQGHRRIGFLPGAGSYENTGERLQGFLEACQSAELPDPTPWILWPGTYHYEQSKERVTKMAEQMKRLPQEERPTVLVCGNDKLAWAAIEAFTAQGISVPDEMSITGFDDTFYSQEKNLPLTTVHQPLHELGSRATEILLRRITGQQDQMAPPPPAVKEFLPYTIVHRDSVKKR